MFLTELLHSSLVKESCTKCPKHDLLFSVFALGVVLMETSGDVGGGGEVFGKITEDVVLKKNVITP